MNATLTVIVVLAANLVLPPCSFAGGWPSDPMANVAGCTAAGSQTRLASTSDSNGGIFIVWGDGRRIPVQPQVDVYAQHFGPNGETPPGWLPSGAPVCTLATGFGLEPWIATDGDGGCLIAYKSSEFAPEPGVYVQRLNGQGLPYWRINGVNVSGATASVGNFRPAIASDWTGGGFVAWKDGRINPCCQSNIFVQHIGGDGTLLWASQGVEVTNVPAISSEPGIVPDGTGGAFVTWHDRRSGTQTQVFAQRISSSGVPLWAANGVAVTTSTENQAVGHPLIIAPDGAGGVYIGWTDNYTGSPRSAYLQHLTSSGTVSPGWPAYGVPLSFNPAQDYWQAGPLLVPDGTGGVVATFRDSRPFGFGIRAQRVDFAGNLLWGASGVSVFGVNGGITHATVPDSAGGFIFGTNSPDGPIYGQRLNGLGEPQWGTDGTLVSTYASQKDDVTASPDGAHGAIFAWSDYRNEPNIGEPRGDIYAQNVNADGTLGGTIVATALALASVEAQLDRVRLRWYSAGERVTAAVYRSRDGGIWTRLANVASDGSGYVEFEDRDVSAGGRYAYRLGVTEGGAETFTATTWVELPLGLTAGFEGPWPQPLERELVLRITTAERERVRLTLHDLQGRTIATLVEGDLEPGQHTRHWNLEAIVAGGLPSAVYFARLETRTGVAIRRVVVAR